MEYFSIFFAGISVVFCIATFVVNRKDKSNNDTKDDSYKWGQVEEKLSNIEKIVAKIENKFDFVEKKVDEKIDKAISVHVESYHKRGRKAQWKKK